MSAWRSLVLAAAVAALCFIPAGNAAAQGSVQVLVRSAGVPLPAAGVTLTSLPDSAIERTAGTDSLGRAFFRDVPAGRYDVRVERLGYTTTHRVIDAGAGPLQVTIEVPEAAVDLPGVVADAERRRTTFEESAGATVAEITQRELKLLPAFGEPDVLRAVEVLPGVVSTSDFSSSFNVRGGGADQNLILLDGLPIYNPFHLGGLFSVFNADMVDRTELMAGGYPAEFGARVSSVLNVESQAAGTGLDIQAGVSLLATRVAAGVDLPRPLLDRFGLAEGRTRVSVRRSYFDQLLKPVFDFPYHLTDLQMFTEAWSPGGARVTLTGYSGRDVLDLAGADSFPLKVRWSWGNDVIGGTWVLPLGSGRVLETRLGYTRFATDIRFPEFGDTEFSSRIQQSLVRTDLSGRTGASTWKVGAAVDWLTYDNLAQTGGTVFGQGSDRGWMLGVYGQQAYRADAWLFETGLRVDGWLPRSTDARTILQPRIAVKRFIGPGEDFAVKLAVGRYAQFTQSLRDEELPLGIDVWVLSGDRAPAVISDQVQAGVEGFLPGRWYVAAEGYYRKFDGVVANNTAENPDEPLDDLLRGDGISYGADLQVRRDRGTVRPMLAVSWLKATRTFDDIGIDPVDPPKLTYAPVFDRRIDIDLVMQIMLPRDWQLGIRWNLGTGLPYTRPIGAYRAYDYTLIGSKWRTTAVDGDTSSAVVLGPRNGERYPVYHRLDAGVRRTFEKRWGTLTPFIDVLNVYNKRNVLFYFYEYNQLPPTRAGISMFPLLPTAGLEVRF